MRSAQSPFSRVRFTSDGVKHGMRTSSVLTPRARSIVSLQRAFNQTLAITFAIFRNFDDVFGERVARVFGVAA